jgi:hypothetical protein
MNGQAAGRAFAAGRIAHVQHDAFAAPAVEPRDRRAQLANARADAERVQYVKADRLQDQPGADRLRRLQFVEHDHARALALEQRRAGEAGDAAAGDGDVEPLHVRQIKTVETPQTRTKR